MFLVVAPTQKELDVLTAGIANRQSVLTLVSGVGILESSLTLHKFLGGSEENISCVLLAGIGGAFINGEGQLLDTCLASKEVLGDLGVCYPDRIEPLDDSFAPVIEFFPDPDLLVRVENILSESAINYLKGPFVTVSSVSGTRDRGDHLHTSHGAICENMEGAAIARICDEFHLPWIEIRCISNLVLDRTDQRWEIDAAVNRCSEVIEIILEQLDCDS